MGQPTLVFQTRQVHRVIVGTPDERGTRLRRLLRCRAERRSGAVRCWTRLARHGISVAVMHRL